MRRRACASEATASRSSSLVPPGDVDDRDLRITSAPGPVPGKRSSRRDSCARRERHRRQPRPDEQRQREAAPADLADVREVRREQRPEVAREKARLEVAKERAPAVARGPERPSARACGGRCASPRAGATARGSHDEPPAGARQAKRQVHVLVVGEEGVVEDGARRRDGLERLAPVERRGRRNARNLEGLARDRGRVRAAVEAGTASPRRFQSMPRRVDDSAVLRQNEALGGGEPLVGAEPRRQPRRVVGLEHGVVVEQQDEGRPRAGDALVGGAGEAQVAGEPDDARRGRFGAEASPFLGPGAVVDHDGRQVDVGLALQGREGPKEGVAAVAVDDDAIHVRRSGGPAQAVDSIAVDSIGVRDMKSRFHATTRVSARERGPPAAGDAGALRRRGPRDVYGARPRAPRGRHAARGEAPPPQRADVRSAASRPRRRWRR